MKGFCFFLLTIGNIQQLCSPVYFSNYTCIVIIFFFLDYLGRESIWYYLRVQKKEGEERHCIWTEAFEKAGEKFIGRRGGQGCIKYGEEKGQMLPSVRMFGVDIGWCERDYQGQNPSVKQTQVERWTFYHHLWKLFKGKPGRKGEGGKS